MIKLAQRRGDAEKKRILCVSAPLRENILKENP
jgi:hypothetical protein